MPNISDDMLDAETDLKFSDWGKTVIYQQVSSSTNYETGVIIDTITETSLLSMTGRLGEKDLPYSNGRGQVGDRTWLFKTSDLPEFPPKDTSRIVHEGVTYQVVGHSQRQRDRLVRVVGRSANES